MLSGQIYEIRKEITTGWLPQCRCYTTSILADKDDFINSLNNDTPLDTSKSAIKDVPQGYKTWLIDNADRIERAKAKGALPYFMRDNKGYSGLEVVETLAEETAEGAERAFNKAMRGLDNVSVDDKVIRLNKLYSGAVDNPIEQDMYYSALKRYTDVQGAARIRHKLRDAKKIQRDWDENRAIFLLRSKLTELCENIPQGKKMTFANNSPYNGHTNLRGDIHLRKDRYDDAISAITKIRKGKSIDITAKEGDALSTLWHEVTHNRHKGIEYSGGEYSKTRSYMELANELTARKTLPDFYKRLGVDFDDLSDDIKAFMHNRTTTAMMLW